MIDRGFDVGVPHLMFYDGVLNVCIKQSGGIGLSDFVRGSFGNTDRITSFIKPVVKSGTVNAFAAMHEEIFSVRVQKTKPFDDGLCLRWDGNETVVCAALWTMLDLKDILVVFIFVIDFCRFYHYPIR